MKVSNGVRNVSYCVSKSVRSQMVLLMCENFVICCQESVRKVSHGARKVSDGILPPQIGMYGEVHSTVPTLPYGR